MAKSRVEIIGIKELRQIIHDMGEGVQKVNSKAGRSGGDLIAEIANEYAPGPHILSRQSKKESNENIAVMDIGPDKEHWYYQFLETGALPHEIKAGVTARREVWLPFGHWRRAKKEDLANATAGAKLAFQGINGLVIIGAVSHPGMKASPFLRQALTRNRDLIQEHVGKVFRAEIDRYCEDKND